MTLAILITIIALIIGVPYCRYVDKLANAHTDKGKEDLAKYLAHRTGGRKIDVENLWRSFLPAARDLHKDHLKKRDQHTTNKSFI